MKRGGYVCHRQHQSWKVQRRRSGDYWMYRHKEAETIVDISWTQTDERTSILWPALWNGQKILGTLLEFSKVWDGHLDSIDVAKHHMELTAPDLRAINRVPFALDQKLTSLRWQKLGNAQHELPEPCRVRMAFSYRICPKKGRFTTNLSRLQITERRDYQGSLPYPKNG